MAKKNVTCVTPLLTTSHHLPASMNYILQSKPHNNDHGRLQHRVLDKQAVNGSLNKKAFISQARKLLELTDPDGKRSVTCIKEVRSFNDALNYRNASDRKLAMDLVMEMEKKEFPHAMLYSVLQADGTHHHLHAHTVAINADLKTGKSLTHNGDWAERAQDITDEVMREHHYLIETPNNPTKVPLEHPYRDSKGHLVTTYTKHYYSPKNISHSTPQFRHRVEYNILASALDSKDIFSFKDNLENSIPVRFDFLSHRTDKDTGKKVLAKPTKRTNPARIVQLPNGKYGKMRKTWSIVSVVHDKHGHLQKVYTDEMGAMFTPTNILRMVKMPKPALKKLITNYRKAQSKRAPLNNLHLKNMRYNPQSNRYYLLQQSSHDSYRALKKRFPYFPARVPQFKPMPIKPHTDINKAYYNLRHALMSTRHAVNQQQKLLFQQELYDSLDQFSKKQKEHALEVADYQNAKAYIKDYNAAEYDRVQKENLAIQAHIRADYQHAHHINRGGGRSWS